MFSICSLFLPPLFLSSIFSRAGKCPSPPLFLSSIFSRAGKCPSPRWKGTTSLVSGGTESSQRHPTRCRNWLQWLPDRVGSVESLSVSRGRHGQCHWCPVSVTAIRSSVKATFCHTADSSLLSVAGVPPLCMQLWAKWIRGDQGRLSHGAGWYTQELSRYWYFCAVSFPRANRSTSGIMSDLKQYHVFWAGRQNLCFATVSKFLTICSDLYRRNMFCQMNLICTTR